MAIKRGKVCTKCGYKHDMKETVCGLCWAKLDEVADPSKDSELGAIFSIDRRGKDKHNKGPSGPGGPPGRPDNTIRCFVLSSSGTPVFCEKTVVSVIGRDDTAQIKVALPKVSRRHAEIRWDGEVAMVYDLGSANGTKVNGEKLAARGNKALADGDEIDVGAGPMTWRVLAPGVSEATLKTTSQVTLVEQAEEPDSGGGGDDDLSGNAALMPLAVIFDRLVALRASGTFHVDSNNIKGSFVLDEGEVITGSYAGLMGDTAVMAVKSLKTGRFRFESSDIGGTPPSAPPPAAAPPAAARPAGGPPTGRPAGPPPGPRPAAPPLPGKPAGAPPAGGPPTGRPAGPPPGPRPGAPPAPPPGTGRMGGGPLRPNAAPPPKGPPPG